MVLKSSDLGPDLSRKALSLIKYDVSCGSFVAVLYLVEEVSLYLYFAESFSSWMLGFVKVFFYILI